jgi:hypothetical protein
MQEYLNQGLGKVLAFMDDGDVLVRDATPEDVALTSYASGGGGGMAGLSDPPDSMPMPSRSPVNLFSSKVNFLGYDAPLWLIVAVAVGGFIAYRHFSNKPSRKRNGSDRMENGFFTDGLRYTAKRLDQRKDRKRKERAARRAAKAKAKS